VTSFRLSGHSKLGRQGVRVLDSEASGVGWIGAEGSSNAYSGIHNSYLRKASGRPRLRTGQAADGLAHLRMEEAIAKNLGERCSDCPKSSWLACAALLEDFRDAICCDLCAVL